MLGAAVVIAIGCALAGLEIVRRTLIRLGRPALRHIADSFRMDNPGLLLPTTALLAVAAAVVWVARRARR